MDTKTYLKPAETFQYVEASSAHPSFWLRRFCEGRTAKAQTELQQRSGFYGSDNVLDNETIISYKHLR
jgi:hypothetical protein